MTTRQIPARVLAVIADLRASGEHDEADAIEAPYVTAPAASSADPVAVIHAQADADVQVIEATADAQEQLIDAQADAVAEVAEAEANTDGDPETPDADETGDSPQDRHWYFRRAHRKGGQ